jgi:glucose/mannose-6-phosphate isomerase
MCEEALGFEVRLREFEPTNIAIVGMGGSGIAGDILLDWVELPIPLQVIKSYELPAWVGKQSLVIAISYSGMTIETLRCFEAAGKRGSKLMAITSNGRLEELCRKRGLPYVKLPPGIAPRAALPYLLFSSIKALREFGLLNKGEELREAIRLLGRLRDLFRPGSKQNEALDIASQLNKTTFCAIYAPLHLKSAGLRLKNQLNENAKFFGKLELFPELNHNEIVSLASASKEFSFIFLREAEEVEAFRRSIEFAKGLLGKGQAIDLFAKGKGKLAKLLSLIYEGDWISFYLAILRGIDPTPTPEITRLKQFVHSGL